jgi:hypothetical protein
MKLFVLILMCLGLGLMALVVLGLATQDPALAHNERIFNECMKREKILMQIRETEGTGLGELSARLACADELKAKGMTPRGTYDPTVGCDARHRDERGVWVWTLSPEARAACKAGKPQ